MLTKTNLFSILITTMMGLSFQTVGAQDKLSWLDDYTGEMQIGSETYRYQFSGVEGNECKLQFEELVTDKKGADKVRSWIFYLSDINPSAIRFKAKGKSVIISMETHQSQKFITYYEGGEIDAYTAEIEIIMNEVDKARSFIETIKAHITNCERTQVTWEERDQALKWLTTNIGKATDKEVERDQKFESGHQSYLVDFQVNSVDGKGKQEFLSYRFDLSDINPKAINLIISGTTFFVEVPVKAGKRFIKVISQSGTAFTNKMLIYADHIELARQMVNALTYVVINTLPERPQWDSYGAALEFVKDHSEEVKIGDELFSNSFNYEAAPSGPVSLEVEKSDSDGTSERVKYVFYMTDIKEPLILEVSKNSITIEMETKNHRQFIRKIIDEKTAGYSSTLSFYLSDLDIARDLFNALEVAIRSSEEKIEAFSTIGGVGSWISENIGSIEADGDQYEQNLQISGENENQLIIVRKLTESDGGSSETRFILYPEDISQDMEIKARGKTLTVLLETAKGKYIKSYSDGLLQNFTGSAEILFTDPLTAKNFIAAIRFLKLNSNVEDRTAISREEAMTFLLGTIQNIDLPGHQYVQKIEIKDEGNCKLSCTRVETNNKGVSDEYIFEVTVTDIDPGSSKFAVKKQVIEMILVTRGKEKLIKPYENGEAGDFEDSFIIYVDDILLAKKTLAAFATLSKECK